MRPGFVRRIPGSFNKSFYERHKGKIAVGAALALQPLAIGISYGLRGKGHRRLIKIESKIKARQEEVGKRETDIKKVKEFVTSKLGSKFQVQAERFAPQDVDFLKTVPDQMKFNAIQTFKKYGFDLYPEVNAITKRIAEKIIENASEFAEVRKNVQRVKELESELQALKGPKNTDHKAEVRNEWMRVKTQVVKDVALFDALVIGLPLILIGGKKLLQRWRKRKK